MVDYSNIKKLAKVLTIEQANDLLSQDWILISTFTFCEDDSLPNDLSVGYVLGKPSSWFFAADDSDGI